LIKKKVNIGINGLGRIGRAIFHNLYNSKNVDIVSINEINNNLENICYTLNYDSTYAIREKKFISKENSIFHNLSNKSIKIYHKDKINDVPWKKDQVEIIIDSSGLKINNALLSDKKLKNIYRIQTNADNSHSKHLIHGVNENTLKKDYDFNLSSSICDSVALSPIIKLLNKYKIISGSVTTVHPLLNYQNPLDSKSASWSSPGSTYGHFELGRGFINNVIPKPTSALSAVSKVLKWKVENKINSFSYRIPTTIVGSADLNINLEKKLSKKKLFDEINLLNKQYKNEIIKISNDKLTSLDYIKNENCCLLDSRWVHIKSIKNNTFIKLVLWYDNEWGYSRKVCDLVEHVAEKIL